MEEINYAEKIANFNLLVGNDNDDIACNYLTITNWDESKAALLYNQENKGPGAQIRQPPVRRNNNSNIFNSDSGYTNQNNLKTNNNKEILKKLKKYKEVNFFQEGILNIITDMFSSDNRSFHSTWQKKYSNCIKLYDVFINNLKTKTGIIILYSSQTANEAMNFFKLINNDNTLKDIVYQRTAIYPLIKDSREGKDLVKQLNIKIFPTFLIVLYKDQKRFALIGQIDKINQNINLLIEKILEGKDILIGDSNNDNKNNYNKNNTDNNNVDNGFSDERKNSFNGMTDGEVLAKQESDLKKLEKIEEDKKKEMERIEKEKIIEENKQKQKLIQEKNEMENALKLLPEEPSDDDPNKCVILFRFPNGEKSKERKFLKTDKISLLYIFVKSLGREIFTENENNNFSLIQTFPRKNFDELQDSTLEQEGMFPNAMLQIQEK